MNRHLLFILTLLLFGCGRNSDNMHSLDIADSLLDTQPDSALYIIKKIDERTLSTKEEKARYGLILTMALLKTNEEEADIRYLNDAIKYYGKSSKPSRETMLTHYALAATSDSTIQKLKEYDKAIELAVDPYKKEYIAKALLNKANIYHGAFSYPDEKECIEQARDLALASNDTSLMIHSLLISGNSYIGISEYIQAIREFNKALGLANIVGIKDEMPYILKSKAYVSSLNGQHTEAVAIYDSLMQHYPSYLNANDICTYASSLAYMNDFSKASRILGYLSQNDIDEYKSDWLYTKAIVEYKKENYKRAFEALDSMTYYGNKIIGEKLDGNLSRQEKLIFQIEAQNQMELSENRRITIWLIVAFGISVIALLCGLIYNIILRHRSRLKEEQLKLEQLRSDSEKETKMLMSKLTALDSMNNTLKISLESISLHSKEIETQLLNHTKTNENLKVQLDDKAKILNDLKESSLINFRLMHRGVASFCNDLPVGISTPTAIKVYEKERDSRLNQYKGFTILTTLNNQINLLMDNILDRLSHAANLTDADIQTIIYEICGFNYRSIAYLMGVTPSAIAVRRTRIKEKFSNTNPSLFEEYKGYVSE